ncbi:RNA polymerase sigma factor SigJ [Ornithinimicrobium murale]|uniref:RNA polymerase sigma factor SigJ n=1 Tax=Ornithinimicrobium murale TaxID=1050153 RepID=UPI001EE0EB3C|nr:RNA polymerase sigma factor SigJ [Ornithinimicrobium murale]
MAETTFRDESTARLMDAEKFEELRPLLFSISYRLLGSVSEAEDAVQETWLRYAATDVEPRSLKAYLATVVSRISIDVLRSARVRREAYVGPWFPEPLPTDTLHTQPYAEPADSAELADSVSLAALLLLERLSPLERAVFVLREVFDYGIADVAEIVERSEPAVRQLASRARRHMQDGRPRFEVDRRKRVDLADRFFDALREGDLDRLQGLLAADVETLNDGGGKGGGQGGSFGPERAARILVATVPPLLASGAVLEPRELNGYPGAILRDAGGRIVGTWTLDIRDGRIRAIHSVTNPDKLAHLGPTGDLRAVVAERNRQRRAGRG